MEDDDKRYKVQIGVKTAPIIRQAVENLAGADERSISQMVELLLKENPRIRAEMERIQESEAAVTV
jgi:hypothetical protein